jgi:hypothetical protein
MSSDVLSIRRETILLVNERLSDPSARVTDATIGAVACLALFEVSEISP